MLDSLTRIRLTEQLKRHEGAIRNGQGRHIAYRDSVGVLTIGYGHNLGAGPIPDFDPALDTLSENEAGDLLARDAHAAELAVFAALPWADGLSPARQAALVNMAFNLGMRGLLGFKNTLADVQAGNYAGAAARMSQSKWAGQVGARARELARQMETGKWI
ncbi:MAG: glycoside hydrolase family protein [Deltaproteobacteria bacterium]|nr:glycoside hydrolase family protein [Deltaproteobacteria bacterium]